jgi:hypothetical protein
MRQARITRAFLRLDYPEYPEIDCDIFRLINRIVSG